MTIALTEEHRALADTVRRWATDRCTSEAVRAVVDAGADEPVALDDELSGQGLRGLHVPEEFGGAGYGTVELAITLEALGRALTPGSFLTTAIVSSVLARTDGVAAKELLPALADGSTTASVALRAGRLVGTETSDGLRVSGDLRPVPLAGSVDLLLVPVTVDGDEHWCLVDTTDTDVTALDSNDPTRRLAAVRCDDVVVPADRVLGTTTGDDVALVASVLVAAEAVGVADWCLDTASSYAAVREQFGQPIGTFQAVKHACADMLVRVEAARALVWDAARALDDGQASELAGATATATALDAAVDNAKACIQILGGIGFTWEHDAHLYLRRATSMRQLAGGTLAARRRAAELAVSGVRRTMELDLGSSAEDARAEVRAFVDEIRDLPDDEQRRRVGDAGYAEPHWPAPWGRDADAVTQLVISQEFAAADISTPDIVIGKWVLPTIIRYGDTAQQEQFIPPTFHGDLVWCQLFSEPGAGSDLAALSTKAVKVDGGWSLTGQKIWTSVAHDSDYGMCLARTNPDAPKHKGITAFIVDMSADGLDIRPLKEITGRAMFNEVFLDDVFVPDDAVIGAVDDGWRAARTTLANERVAMSSGSTMGRGVEGVLAMLDEGEIDPVVLDAVGRFVCEGQALGVLSFRQTLAALSGVEPGSGSSVRKLIGMGHAQDVAELCMELLGPEGATLDGPAKAVVNTFLHARCLTIAGGTTEVQKNVVAERILGLPRDDAR